MNNVNKVEAPGELMHKGGIWPETAWEFYSACSTCELETILCGGIPQQNVFGRYNLTVGEHIQLILQAVRGQVVKKNPDDKVFVAVVQYEMEVSVFAPTRDSAIYLLTQNELCENTVLDAMILELEEV